MDTVMLQRKITRRGFNPASVARTVMREPRLVPILIEGMRAEKPSMKYGSARVLRLISGERPDLAYPYFDDIAAMLDSDNSILKWGAILCLADLAAADTAGKFESMFSKYFQPISGPVMITAGNIMRGSARIALAKPYLADRIAAEILRVERARYKTTECRSIAIGHAIDAFSLFFDHIQDKRRVVRFIQGQIRNPRPAVRRRAENFLRQRNIPSRQKDAK